MSEWQEAERFAALSRILELRYGPRWKSAFPAATDFPKSTLWAVFSRERALTDDIYTRMLAAIDVELERMQTNLKEAKAIRKSLK